MKIFIYSAIFNLLLLCQQQKITPEPDHVCYVDNPAKELQWLKDRILTFELSMMMSTPKIYAFTHQDTSMIVFKEPNHFIAYNCAGSVICQSKQGDCTGKLEQYLTRIIHLGSL